MSRNIDTVTKRIWVSASPYTGEETEVGLRKCQTKKKENHKLILLASCDFQDKPFVPCAFFLKKTIYRPYLHNNIIELRCDGSLQRHVRKGVSVDHLNMRIQHGEHVQDHRHAQSTVASGIDCLNAALRLTVDLICHLFGSHKGVATFDHALTPCAAPLVGPKQHDVPPIPEDLELFTEPKLRNRKQERNVDSEEAARDAPL